MKNYSKFILAAMLVCSLLLAACGKAGGGGFGANNDPKQFVYLHNWTREGVKNHFNAGSDVGPLAWFSVEGLAQFVRVSDEVSMRLAEKFDHLPKDAKGNIITKVTLRASAKWQNGDDFVADDVISFYLLHHTTITKHLLKIEKGEHDKIVNFFWNPKYEPTDTMKTLLLSQDKAGSVQYKEFKKYVDRCGEILASCPDIAENSNVMGPFNKELKDPQLGQYFDNYQQFKEHAPDWFVATGPYKLNKMSSTEMLLVKNELYYDAENVKFESVRGINGVNDLTTIYSQLQSGGIDYQNSTPPIDTIREIINKNTDMVHYKMYDPGAIGMIFNLKKKIFQDMSVREAFQYIFDRDNIKNLSNYYGVTSYYPILSMCPSETDTYVSDEGKSYLKENRTYSYNSARAEELLKEAGWNKKGKYWHDASGKQVKLILGYDGSNSYFTGAAQAAAAQLNAFGFQVQQKRTGDWATFYATASSPTTEMDVMVGWTDLNLTFSYPGGSFLYMYDNPVGDLLHLDRFTKDDKENYEKYGSVVSTKLTGLAGNQFNVADYYQTLYTIQDGEQLKRITTDLVVGAARELYGVQFFQNVTGAFYNMSKIGGLPYENRMIAERNSTYVPSVGADFNAVAKINLYYSQGLPFADGTLYPKK